MIVKFNLQSFYTKKNVINLVCTICINVFLFFFFPTCSWPTTSFPGLLPIYDFLFLYHTQGMDGELLYNNASCLILLIFDEKRKDKESNL